MKNQKGSLVSGNCDMTYVYLESTSANEECRILVCEDKIHLCDEISDYEEETSDSS
jgi:hypothetical protein